MGILVDNILIAHLKTNNMKKIFFHLLMFVGIFDLNAQINIDDQLKRRINSKFRVKVWKTTNVGLLKMQTSEYKRMKEFDYKVIAGDANVIKSRIVYLPEQIVVNYYSNKNCTEAKRGWTQELTLKVTQGEIVKFSKTHTSESGWSHNFGIKIPFVNFGPFKSIEPSYSAIYNSKSSSGDVNENQQSNTREETIARTINLEVDSNKALFVKFQVTNYSIRAPFVATITVDGNVTLEKILARKINNSVDEDIKGEEVVPLRSLLSKAERTFNISGFLESSKAGMEEVTFAEISLPRDSCEQFIVQPLIAIMEKLSNNKSLNSKESEQLKANPLGEAIKNRARKMKFKKLTN